MPDGLALVDKPAGWTSHDVVAKARGLLRTKKVGHAGTLDPDATGLLLLGVGKATRLLRFLSGLGKTYDGELVLGVETSTLDAAGEVTATHDMGGVTAEQVRAAAASLTGHLLQVPPMVSALKVGGRRLHELAREGIEVEREARPVVVDRFVVAPTDDPLRHRYEVTCSSGTYVRSLVADLGRALGGGAHVATLRRTSVGPWPLERAVPLAALGPDAVLPPAACVAHLAAVVVDDELRAAVGHGKVLAPSALGAVGEGPWAVLDGHGELLAVYEAAGPERAKPALVLG